MSNTVAVVLLVIGVVLIVIELAVPGFGLPGIGGLAAVTASIIIYSSSVKQAVILMVIAAAIIFGLFLISSLVFSKKSALVLSEAEIPQEGYVAPRISEKLVGKEGVSETDLRPSGAARIDGLRISVVTGGEYISKGEKIKVVSVAAGKVKVIKED